MKFQEIKILLIKTLIVSLKFARNLVFWLLCVIPSQTWRAPESLAPQLPQLIRALKRWPALSNEPEVTPLLHLWQGLPRWKLDDLEAACRCGESGRGVGGGTKRDVPSSKRQLAPCAQFIQSEDLGSLELVLTSTCSPPWIELHLSPKAIVLLLLPTLRYLPARGKLSRLVRVIALMKARLISIFLVCSSQIVPRSLVATRDL